MALVRRRESARHCEAGALGAAPWSDPRAEGFANSVGELFGLDAGAPW